MFRIVIVIHTPRILSLYQCREYSSARQSSAKGKVCAPPFADDGGRSVTEARAKLVQDILQEVWPEVEYRFDISEATHGTHADLFFIFIN